LVSWVGVRFVILIKNSIVRLPETYAIQIEPAIRDIFENVEKASAKLDPMMVQVIQDIAASISQSTGSVITKISSTVIDFISSSVSFLPGLFLGIIFAVISSLFFAIDYNKITAYISNRLPSKNSGLFTEIKTMATGIGFQYVKAYAILMAVTFSELAIGLLLLRVDGAIEVAALIAVIDFLPVLGTGGVVIPWIFIELIQGNFPFAFGLTVLYLLITVVRNILEPKLIGEQIGLHPLIMLISMYVGVKIFGFVGLIALPVTIVIIKHLYDNDKIHIFKQETDL
jgi:sporulation integral membrane protein YtvI